jgi:hypothetical protein
VNDARRVLLALRARFGVNLTYSTTISLLCARFLSHSRDRIQSPGRREKDGEGRPGRAADDVGLHGPDIVPVFRSVLMRRGLLRLVVTLQTFFLWLLLLVSGGRRVEPEASSSEPARTKAHRRRTATEEEDVRRCRALAEEVVMAGHLPRPRGQGERALLLAAREMR